MPGSKIPVLEIEKLNITRDGRGFIFYEGDRLHRDWRGTNFSGSNTTGTQFLPAASSAGWMKIHVVSGSTYGPTGASYYVPLFESVGNTS